MPRIAIIILNWNGLDDTLECLGSLPETASIYVVDNASKNNELASIKKPVIKIQNAANLGFAEGNNVGIRRAIEDGADWICTLNNDTVVDRHFLENAEERISIMPSTVGIIAPLMLQYDDRVRIDNTGHELLTTGDTIPRDRNRLLKAKEADQEDPFGACAGAALYRVEMLRHIGLFDSDFFLNYEDSDLSLRAIVQGWRVVHCEELIVYHKGGASIGKIKDSAYRVRSQRNMLMAYLHSVPALVLLLNLPCVLLRDFLALGISAITLQWTVLSILIRSRMEVLKNFPLILKKRREIQKNRIMSSWEFWRRQGSWTMVYFQYLKEFLTICFSPKRSPQTYFQRFRHQSKSP